MNYTENYKGIKIDVQTPQVDLRDGLQAQIRKSIDKISRFTDNINAVDIYFNISGTGKTPCRKFPSKSTTWTLIPMCNTWLSISAQ